MTTTSSAASVKAQKYKELLPQLQELILDEPDPVANLSNAVALLNQTFEEFSWVGVYLKTEDEELVVGPYQGKVACTRIPKGQGVCGTVVHKKKLMRVDDVAKHENHIYCDPETQSEIVVPIWKGEEVMAVLDIDSHTRAYFDETDEEYLTQVAQQLTPLV